MLFQGMVDPGESVSKALQMEFDEKVKSAEGLLSEEEAEKIKKRISEFMFSGGNEVS